MMVLVLSACPVGLRGDLTKWLYEVSAGVFVGKVSSRIRKHLWDRVLETSGSGRAILIWSSKGEQGLKFEVKDHHWDPVDLDGLTLMKRRSRAQKTQSPELKRGWSKAGAQRHLGRRR
ncbi:MULTISPECIES: type I-E CRISPR-associated endoribonuclease Cas2e [Kocuria]|nr:MULTISPECIES: type I-E CRISPR-associated endoribonuclease Cas2e [unclassified Kocuria]MBX7557559.1 type I-E CRISPR-associated endoribonuclease Cas2e [Streptomyces sp. tea 10]